MAKKQIHWADHVAQRVIKEKGDKKEYTVAAGITPSGTIHIGNFREIITNDLVCRALESLGKKVRFIYSWDDYDVFRKVPANMPKQDMLKKHLRKPIVDVPDPFETEENYARHNIVESEQNSAKVGINPEYIYQSKKYRNCDYVEGIKTGLQKKKEIKIILDKHRKEPLKKDWMPITGFCPECGLDKVSFSDYDGNYGIKMACLPCNKTIDVDLKKAPFVKLLWRVDWPMRWAYEKVDFEPGGKEHSTPGGSFDTAKEIVKLYDWIVPTYQRYDYIIVKGVGGKISSSKGNVITLADCLEVYEPDIIRWLFAGTRPNTEFSISFDLDVIGLYEEFDKVERIYFKEKKTSEQEYEKQKRIYELSCVGEPPKKLPFQPSFRHLTNVLLVHEMNVEKAMDYYIDQLRNDFDKQRLRTRANCAKNWIEKHAPEDFRYTVNKHVPRDLKLLLNMRKALREVAKRIKEKEWNDQDLHLEFYVIVKNFKVDNKAFFKAAYNVLISKDKGPRLAHFILTIGKHRVAKLFEEV